MSGYVCSQVRVGVFTVGEGGGPSYVEAGAGQAGALFDLRVTGSFLTPEDRVRIVPYLRFSPPDRSPSLRAASASTEV